MKWAKVAWKYSTYGMTLLTKNPKPKKKVFFIVNYKTYQVFWAFKQLELCLRKATCEQVVFMQISWINPALNMLITCNLLQIIFIGAKLNISMQNSWCHKTVHQNLLKLVKSYRLIYPKLATLMSILRATHNYWITGSHVFKILRTRSQQIKLESWKIGHTIAKSIYANCSAALSIHVHINLSILSSSATVEWIFSKQQEFSLCSFLGSLVSNHPKFYHFLTLLSPICFKFSMQIGYVKFWNFIKIWPVVSWKLKTPKFLPKMRGIT